MKEIRIPIELFRDLAKALGDTYDQTMKDMRGNATSALTMKDTREKAASAKKLYNRLDRCKRAAEQKEKESQ